MTWEQYRVANAVLNLNHRGRTTNNSQIASVTGLSRQRVADATAVLSAAGYIRDTGKGAAYHWRRTAKPLPKAREETRP